MPLNGQLQASQYLLGAYGTASREHAAFRSTGEVGHLLEAGQALCAALQQLANDGVFWAALIDFAQQGEGERSEVRTVLQDLERLADKEHDVLVGLGVDRASAERLSSDLQLAVGMWRDGFTGGVVMNLQNRVQQFQAATCADRGIAPVVVVAPLKSVAGSEDRLRFWRQVRFVGRALLIVGGAAVFVANGVTGLLGRPDALASMSAGAILISAGTEGRLD